MLTRWRHLLRGRKGTGRSEHEGLTDGERSDAASLAAGWAAMDTTVAAEQEDLGSQIMKESIKAELFGLARRDRRIGRFTLLEPIGAGAHGEIYTAYDDQLDRKVAVKLVKPDHGAPHDSGERRLLREAVTLARLSHPNVVQVYEAGMFSGRVFLAMELIRGVTLRAWIASQADTPERLRWRRILDKFIQAGRGLHAAHAAGLVHRDFKPDNALVASDGRVRVVDFGLARADGDAPPRAAVDASVTAFAERSLEENDRLATEPAHAPAPMQRMARMTATGGVAGTPAYMSPEQYDGRTVDARSDQFSFCVALYEALYGRRPFPAGDLAGLRQEVQSGAYVTPERQDGTPRWVWNVIERGLAADPDERYPDMAALIAALERDPARWQRRVAAVAAVAAVAFGAGALIVYQTAAPGHVCAGAAHEVVQAWSPVTKSRLRAAFEASRAPSAGATWDLVEERMGRYAGALAEERVAACEDTRVHETQSELEYALRSQCLDRRQRQLDALLDRFAEADEISVAHAVQAVAALPRADACRNREALVLGVRLPDDAALAKRVDAVRGRLAKGHAARLVGQMADARAVARRALDEAEGLPFPPVRAEALYLLGTIELVTGDAGAVAQATTLLLDAVDIAEAHRHDELAADAWLDLTLLAIRYHPDPARGLAWVRRALAASARIGDPARRARALSYRGELHLRGAGRDPAAAEQDQRDAIATAERIESDPLTLADLWHGLGNALLAGGRSDEAREAFERALGIFRGDVGTDHPRAALLQYDYARWAREAGELDQARRLLHGVLETWRTVHGAGHIQAGHTLRLLANLEQEAGNLDQAEAHARASLDIYGRVLPPEDPRLAEPLNLIGIVQFRRRQFEAALTSYRAALEIQRQRGPRDVYVLLSRANIAEVLVKLGRHDQALAELDQLEPLVTDNAPLIIRVLVRKARGMALLGQGNAGQALPPLEQALALIEGRDGMPVERADVMWALARALRATGGTPARARELAQQARALYAVHGDAGMPEAHAIDRWLQK